MTRTATAPKPAEAAAITLARPSPGPVFVPTDRASLIVRGGTVFYIGSINHVFDVDTPVIVHDLIVGGDCFIRLVDNVLQASPADDADLDGVLGGFHYAPGGNATARRAVTTCRRSIPSRAGTSAIGRAVRTRAA
jgi:hypothetical protein